LKHKYPYCISSYWEVPLSEVLKFSTADLKVWLERETGSIFVPVHMKAQKLLDEMRRVLENLVDSSKMLLENSGKEIDKRNMKTYGRARALNKLAKLFVERYRKLKAPEKVTYENVDVFVKEIQKAFAVTEIDIRNWFPRISPFFILDRRKFQTVFERSKIALKELDGFVSKDYVKTKTLEDTFQLIDKLTTLESQLKELEEKKVNVEANKAAIKKQMMELQHRMDKLETTGGVGQLGDTGDEILVLREELKYNLRHLRKPFIKLQSLATHGSGSGLTPEELKKLAQYLEDPFKAISIEEAGYPLLRQILGKLAGFISEDKLKLKTEKARKAEQAINNINDNSLANLHQKCKSAMTRKTKLSTSEEVVAAQKDLTKLDEHLELLKRKKGVLEAEEFTINRNHAETMEKIQSHKSEIEKNVLSFTSKKIVVA
jgi:hypothetical protein